MFLVETERGCSRACTYCVMRRSTNGGMRVAPMERILELVPDDARRVGLVGAAVSDHPRIAAIVNTLADDGREVGLSSLRPDRLNDEFVGALARAGTQTLTTAMDGPSERLRESLERRARVRHLVRCAELAKKHKMDRLKLYLMIGLPGETDADIDECVAFTTELTRIVPVSLGIAPFCAKRNTPLDGQPFAGIDVVTDRLDRLEARPARARRRAFDEREVGLGRVRSRAGGRSRGARRSRRRSRGRDVRRLQAGLRSARHDASSEEPRDRRRLSLAGRPQRDRHQAGPGLDLQGGGAYNRTDA